MAGTYPDSPANRIQWDNTDVAKSFVADGNNRFVTEFSEAWKQILNDEDGEHVDINISVITFMEPMDIVGMQIWGRGSNSDMHLNSAYSTDSNSGHDGTWTELDGLLTELAGGPHGDVRYREDIDIVNLTGVTAFRFQAVGDSFHSRQNALLLYGYPSDRTRDRAILELVEASSDNLISPSNFDWGDIAQGGTAQSTFRVKNRSSLFTATNVEVSFDTFFDSTPSLVGQHEFSLDGSTWSQTLDVGNVAPLGFSPTITMRATIDPTQPLGLWWGRMNVVTESWTAG